MKTATTLIFLTAALAGCASAPRREEAELTAPTAESLVGTYAIIEETVSGRPLEVSGVANARLEIRENGDVLFQGFPVYVPDDMTQTSPLKITEAGRWSVKTIPDGYALVLVPSSAHGPFDATIVRGGNPSDLMIYYGRVQFGRFTKWGKVRW